MVVIAIFGRCSFENEAARHPTKHESIVERNDPRLVGLTSRDDDMDPERGPPARIKATATRQNALTRRTLSALHIVSLEDIVDSVEKSIEIRRRIRSLV